MNKLLLLVPLLISPLALADPGYGYGHMSGGSGVLMFLGMSAIWVLLIAAGVWVFTQMKTSVPRRPTSEDSVGIDPATIVKQRFARGEISETEMNDLLKKLK